MIEFAKGIGINHLESFHSYLMPERTYEKPTTLEFLSLFSPCDTLAGEDESALA